jgi:uncharacterized protein
VGIARESLTLSRRNLGLADPEGLWRLSPRPVNCMRDIPGFIAAWDTGIGDPSLARRRYKLRRSRSGNVNRSGREGDLAAPSVAHWHPQFAAAVEPGVWPLVLSLIQDGRWISYTSCAGHFYMDGPHQPCQRHVGLLPRDEKEHREIVVRLVDIVCQSRHNKSFSHAEAALVSDELHDRDRSYPVVDIYLMRRHNSGWEFYFREIDSATASLVDVIKRSLGHARDLYHD